MACAHDRAYGQTPYPVENLKIENQWIKARSPLVAHTLNAC